MSRILSLEKDVNFDKRYINETDTITESALEDLISGGGSSPSASGNSDYLELAIAKNNDGNITYYTGAFSFSEVYGSVYLFPLTVLGEIDSTQQIDYSSKQYSGRPDGIYINVTTQDEQDNPIEPSVFIDMSEASSSGKVGQGVISCHCMDKNGRVRVLSIMVMVYTLKGNL